METISHFHHIAIVVKNINEVIPFYEEALGLKITATQDIPQRGIKTAFIKLKDTMIELIEPLHEQSEVSKFLAQRGPGIHHIALKTLDIEQTQERLKEHGTRLVYDQAQNGAHNTKVNFIHPTSSGGVLFEIVE